MEHAKKHQVLKTAPPALRDMLKGKETSYYKASMEKRKAEERESYKASMDKRKAKERENYKTSMNKRKGKEKSYYEATMERRKAEEREYYKASMDKRKAKERENYKASMNKRKKFAVPGVMDEYEFEVNLSVVKRPAEKSISYAVFEKPSVGMYLIYEICVDRRSTTKRKLKPILTTGFCFPIYMGIFSVGSKIYLFGGLSPVTGSYVTDVYIFDTRRRCNPSLAPKMNHPKLFPCVFGPLDGTVYIFSEAHTEVAVRLSPSRCTDPYRNLEMFDTRSEEWTSIELKRPFKDTLQSGPESFTCSAFCGSEIVLFSADLAALHIYSTTSKSWREYSSDIFFKSPNPRFPRMPSYLFETRSRCFVLGMYPNYEGAPPVTLMAYSWQKTQEKLPDAPFVHSHELSALLPNKGPGVGHLISCMTQSQNSKCTRSYIITSADRMLGLDYSYVFKVCNIKLQDLSEAQGDDSVHFKSQGLLEYNLRPSGEGLVPRYFFVA